MENKRCTGESRKEFVMAARIATLPRGSNQHTMFSSEKTAALRMKAEARELARSTPLITRAEAKDNARAKRKVRSDRAVEARNLLLNESARRRKAGRSDWSVAAITNDLVIRALGPKAP